MIDIRMPNSCKKYRVVDVAAITASDRITCASESATLTYRVVRTTIAAPSSGQILYGAKFALPQFVSEIAGDQKIGSRS